MSVCDIFSNPVCSSASSKTTKHQHECVWNLHSCRCTVWQMKISLISELKCNHLELIKITFTVPLQLFMWTFQTWLGGWRGRCFRMEFSCFKHFGEIIHHLLKNRDHKKRKSSKSSVKYRGGSLMTWGCFAAVGSGPLVKTNSIMDSAKYKDIWCQKMVASAKRLRLDHIWNIKTMNPNLRPKLCLLDTDRCFFHRLYRFLDLNHVENHAQTWEYKLS